MLETALRLFQIATYLKLTKLADYAERVFLDYLDLMWCHFDESKVTLAQQKCYAGEIELVGRGLAARGTNEATETLVFFLSNRCAALSKDGTWLDKAIASLHQNIPEFKKTYDRAVARR